MPDATPAQRCRLCLDPLMADALLDHLRLVHEVTPGEITVADIPADRPVFTRAWRDDGEEIRMTPVLA